MKLFLLCSDGKLEVVVPQFRNIYMYMSRVYATNSNRAHIWEKIINECLSVTNVDLSGTKHIENSMIHFFR